MVLISQKYEISKLLPPSVNLPQVKIHCPKSMEEGWNLYLIVYLWYC